MKKVLFQCLSGLLFTVVTINHISAQNTAILQPNHIDPKAIVINLDEPKPDPVSNALPLNAVSAKAIRTFNSSFKGASNLQWYPGEEQKFLAIFISKDGRSSRALIDKTGYLYYGISYGKEENLTKEQRKSLKLKYFDYSINYACEIISNGQRIWVIILEDENNIVKTRIMEDGSIDELEHYHKKLPAKKTRNVNQ
jgi:hypothetical protein